MAKPVAVLEAVPYQPEADSFDFQKSWAKLSHACAAHKFLILLTCLFTVGLTALYIKVWPPVFIAEVTLVGESDKDHSRENFYQTWAVFRSDQLTDEVRMVTMAPVLTAVVRKLNLSDDDVYHSFFSYISYRWTTSPIGIAYRQFKETLFPSTPAPYAPTPEEIKFGRTLLDFKSGVQLDRVMETNIGKLIVRGPSPRVAEVANTIVQVYSDQRRERHIQEADAAYNSLNVELEKAQKEIADVEQTMRQYYADNDLLLTFEKDKIEIGQAQSLKAAISELTTNITGNEQTLRQVEVELANEEKDVVSSRVIQANPIRDGLRDKLSNLQIQRKQALINYRPDSPEIKDVDRQIAIFTEQLRQEPLTDVRQTTLVLSSRYEELRGRAATLRAELAGERAALTAKSAVYDKLVFMLRSIPEKMRMVHDMERQHSTLEKKLGAIQEKMMIAAVSRATAETAYSSIRVAEPAVAPGEATWPKTKLLLLIAVAAGLLAGVLLALLMDLFFGRVHRFRLASAGVDLPIYAIVGRDRVFARDLFALPPPDEPEPWSPKWKRR